LCAHEEHNKEVLLMHINHPNEIIDLGMVKPPGDGIKHCIALANTKSTHFAVLSIDLEDHVVAAVYDGKRYPLKTWTLHILNILKRLQLVQIQLTDNKVLEHGPFSVKEEDRIGWW
jgi:hypothetical protein